MGGGFNKVFFCLKIQNSKQLRSLSCACGHLSLRLLLSEVGSAPRRAIEAVLLRPQLGGLE